VVCFSIRLCRFVHVDALATVEFDVYAAAAKQISTGRVRKARLRASAPVVPCAIVEWKILCRCSYREFDNNCRIRSCNGFGLLAWPNCDGSEYRFLQYGMCHAYQERFTDTTRAIFLISTSTFPIVNCFVAGSPLVFSLEQICEPASCSDESLGRKREPATTSIPLGMRPPGRVV